MKNYPLPLLTALVVFLPALPLFAEETQVEQTLLSSRIGKWQQLVILTGNQVVPEGGGGVSGLAYSYYAIDIDNYTRDRDGQGVYREGVQRILHCDANDATLRQLEGGMELVLKFRQSQGEEQATVQVAATRQTDGEERYYTVKFSGKGGVHDQFQQRLAESTDGAEWVESIDEMRWKYFPPKPAPAQASGALHLFPGGSKLDTEVYPLGWAKDGTQLAVLQVHPYEAGEEREWEILLMDLVSDKVVVSKVIPFDSEQGYAEFIAAHGATVDAICRNHGNARAEMNIHPFPALLDEAGGRVRSESYSVNLTNRRVEAVDTDPGDYRHELEVILSKGSVSKSIIKKSWPGWEGDPVRATGVIGYIPNPNSTRLAVVIGVVERGYEGAPHLRQLLIVGARVGKNF